MTPEVTQQEAGERVPYESPAIIYEGEITTRAGTTGIEPAGADPADLFGTTD